MAHVREECSAVSSESAALEGSTEAPRMGEDGESHESLAEVSPTVDCNGAIILSIQEGELDVVPIPALSQSKLSNKQNREERD